MRKQISSKNLKDLAMCYVVLAGFLTPICVGLYYLNQVLLWWYYKGVAKVIDSIGRRDNK